MSEHCYLKELNVLIKRELKSKSSIQGSVKFYLKRLCSNFIQKNLNIFIKSTWREKHSPLLKGQLLLGYQGNIHGKYSLSFSGEHVQM